MSDITCPSCGKTKAEKDYQVAIHQQAAIVDIGFRCDCGNEFGLDQEKGKKIEITISCMLCKEDALRVSIILY